MNKVHNLKLMGSLALIVGLGLALGSTTGSLLTGVMVALPIGLATYYGYEASGK